MFETFNPTPEEHDEQDALDEEWARLTAGGGSNPAADPGSSPPAKSGAPDSEDSLGKAAGRGVLNAIAEQTDTVLEAGQAVAEKTGLFDLLGYTEEERTAENPLGNWLREKRKQYLDVEESNIGYAMVEGITQFTTGMVGLSKLKAGLAVKGAVADFSAFDPQAERLSNVMQDLLPERIGRLVWTAADSDDTALVGRAKQALEGFLVGATLDKFVAGARVIAKRGKNPQAAAAAIAELADETPKAGRWDVQSAGDQHTVVNPAGEPVATMPTRQAAESFASSSAVEERLARVSLDDNLRGRIKAAAEKLAAEPGADLEHILAEIGDVNPIYVSMSQEGKAWTAAIAHEVRETMHGGRFAGKMDWDSLTEDATAFLKREGLDTEMDPLEWLNAVTDDTFARADGAVRSVEDATAAMQAYRISRAKATEQLKFWSEKLDLTPDDPKAIENFQRALQAATDFHYYQATLGSRFGAGLNSRKIPVGEGGALRDATPVPGAPAERGHKKTKFRTVKTEADAADLRETMKGAREAAEAAQEAKLTRSELAAMRKALTAQKGSAGVTAADFQKARITDRIRRIQAALDKANAPQPDVDLSELGIATRSAEVLEDADGRTLRRGPAGFTVNQTPEVSGNPIEKMSRWLDQAEDALDDALAPKLEKVAPRAAKQKSPITEFVAETKKRQGAQERVGGKIAGALEHNRRYLRDLDEEKVTAIAKEMRELEDATMTLTEPEMRALARHLATLTDEGELEYAYDALTAYFKKKGAGEFDAPATTMRGLWSQTPNTSSFGVLEGTTTARGINFLLGYRMNALLSGPKTQGTNILSGLANSLYLPLEKSVAGVLGFNPEQRREGLALLAGIFDSYQDSWRMAKATFKTGKDSLDSFHGQRNLSLPEWAQSSWPLKLMQMPQRLLMTADEFFKQMSYRSSVRAQSLEASLKAGIDDAAVVQARLASDMKAAFNNGIIDPSMKGAAVNPRALKFAREVTWTQPMDGTFSKKFLQMVEAHPELRLVVPFVRIPTNIMKWQFERFPVLGLLVKKNFDALRPGSTLGKEARNEAMARQAMGAFFAGSAYLMAQSGQITGRGPSDPRLRREWLDADFRPYSVKIPGTNQWVEYRRLEPFASAFGLAADFRDIRGELDRDQDDEVFAALTQAFANFTLNKTYMKGLSDAFDALGGGNGSAAHRMFSNTLGSFVPNVLNQTNPDDVMRETRTYLDEVMSRVPGFSEMLEPRRNFYGEPVVKQVGWGQRAMNPLASASMFQGGDAWLKEIVELGEPIGRPESKIDDFDLTDRNFWKRKDGKNQSPYDRWMELTGNPGDGMPSLKSVLKEMVESPEWKNVPAGTAQEPGGMRAQMVRSQVMMYRNLAWQMVQQEYEGPGGARMDEFLLNERMKKLELGDTVSPIAGSYFK